MQKISISSALYIVIFFCAATPAAAQKTSPKTPASYPNLILKISFQNQVLTKAKEIQKKAVPGNKLPGAVISPLALKNSSNAGDFIAAYKVKNTIVGPMFLPNPYRTYLRIGEPVSGISPVKDKVVSAFFNETEQSCLMADMDFTNKTAVNTKLTRDVVSAWVIENAGSTGFKISTAGAKKYISIKRTGGIGTEKINLTTDINDLSTNWVLYSSAENGITFYNPAFNMFLGRIVRERKIFLVPLSYKDYGNDALRKTIIINWDLYNQPAAPVDSKFCFDVQHSHSLQYMLTRPAKDADGDRSISLACGGTDCDDEDGSKFPGNEEQPDLNGIDNDCNPNTYPIKDADGDGYNDSRFFNMVNGVITSQGTDCDDSNPAIFPGVQIFINETTVEVCGTGIFEVTQGFMAVKQPNGTAIVIPRK